MPSKKITNFLLLSFGLIAFLFLIIAFIGYRIHFNGGFSNANEDWGTFGDFFGGTLNPIFSFLGLIALLYTISAQGEELDLSRTELMLTREELSRSANAQIMAQEALHKQVETQNKQQFENTFFSLLEQHNKILDTLIERKIENNREMSVASKILGYVISKPGAKEDLRIAKNVIELNNHTCGHYFRTLYQLLKLIATNVPNSNIGAGFNEKDIISAKFAPNEKMYSNIVRSFLNYEITQLLAINCYCETQEDTYWRFKLLIERYSFLEHMPLTFRNVEFKLFTLMLSHYNRNAFGKSEFINW